MQPLIEHRRRFAGVETRVLELEGEGPALVLLHGYADSADTWRHVLALLGRRDRRAVAVDMPGFGAADRLSPGAILPQLDEFAAAVAADASHGEDVFVVGNSLGGAVALRLAERAGLPLGGVVPVAPAGLDMARWFVMIERDPIVRGLLALPAPVPERVVRELVGRAYRLLAFARPRMVAREVVTAFTSHHRDRATVRRQLDTARRLLPELADPFELERVRCPVLLVWGDKDRLVSPSGAERVTAALPDVRLESIEDCGHCPQVECPERLVDLLLEFAPPVAQAA